jgi:hypothetical protein
MVIRISKGRRKKNGIEAEEVEKTSGNRKIDTKINLRNIYIHHGIQ